MRVVLLNPNTSGATTATMVDLLRAALPVSLDVEGRTAPFGMPLITDAESLATARRAVLEMAASLPGEASAVVVAAFGDPGLSDLRRRLFCPVVGIGEAALLEAGANGRRFSVATTTPGLVRTIGATVEALGLGPSFCSVRLASGDPVELMKDAGRLAESLATAARRAQDDGAEVVVVGGGPLGIAARRLAELVTLPVVEPLAAAARRVATFLS